MIMLAGEEQRGPLAGEVRLEGRRLAIEFRGQLRIGRLLDELEGGEEIVRAAFCAAP